MTKLQNQFETGLWLSSADIPGRLNIEADENSRKTDLRTESKLNRTIFHNVLECLQCYPERDLFASRLNTQLLRFFSWRPDSFTEVTNAFSVSWEKKNFYCFPSFPCIGKLKHVTTKIWGESLVIQHSKTYCSTLKFFYSDKRVPVIPALLVNNKFVIDFKAKANIFNDFFSKQGTPLANGSNLPENQVYLTNSRINSVPFSDDLVMNIIRNLNVNKFHSCDNISTRMIKRCDEFLLRPLSIIFRNSLKSSIYHRNRVKNFRS